MGPVLSGFDRQVGLGTELDPVTCTLRGSCRVANGVMLVPFLRLFRIAYSLEVNFTALSQCDIKIKFRHGYRTVDCFENPRISLYMCQA